MNETPLASTSAGSKPRADWSRGRLRGWLLASLVCALAAAGHAALSAHVTDRYPAAYRFAADKCIPLAEHSAGEIRRAGFGAGGVELVGVSNAVRFVMRGIEPGAYLVGIHGRTSHGGGPSETVGAYRLWVDGQSVPLRAEAPDTYVASAAGSYKIVMGTVLSVGKLRMKERSTVDVAIRANNHSIEKVLLFRDEKDVAGLPDILKAFLKERGESHRLWLTGVPRAPPPAASANPPSPPATRPVQNAVPTNLTPSPIEDQGVILHPPADAAPRWEWTLTNAWNCLPVADAALLDRPLPKGGAWRSIPMPIGQTSAGAFYRLHLTLADSPLWRGRYFVLKFDRVTVMSDIYIDGRRVGGNLAASEAFIVNATPHLRPGQKHTLLLAVRHWASMRERSIVDASCIRGGIGVPPRVIACGPAFVEWVFCRPSVRSHTLSVDAHVWNLSTAPLAVRVRHEVVDDGRTALTLDGDFQALAPTSMTVLTSSRAWPEARLWWPHDQHMYTVRTKVSTPDAVADRPPETAFGFREFWLDRTDYVLNGTPMFLWTWTKNQNFRRFHLSTGLDRLLETPSTNYLCIPEFAVDMNWNWSDPRLWANFEAHAAGWARKLYNHPAVTMYSLANEVLHCGIHYRYPEVPRRLAELGRALARVDPTRPYMFNGDGDLLGNPDVPIINIHYPRNLSKARLLPDDIRCYDGTGVFPIDSNLGRFSWDRRKPLFVGEDWWLDTVGYPWAMSAHFGEKVYEGYMYRLPYWWRAAEYYVNHWRVNGIKAVNHWYVALCDWQPVDVFDETFRFIYPAGPVQRPFRVVNETLAARDLVVEWALTDAAGRTASISSNALTLAAGGNAQVTVALNLPATERPAVCRLQATIRQGTNSMRERAWTFVAVPPDPVPLAGVTIGMAEPAGTIADRLRRAGADVRGFGDDSAASNRPVWLIEGAALADRDLAARLPAFLSAGGRVLYLTTGTSPAWTPLPLDWTPAEANFAFIRAPNHPLLASYDDAMFALWHPGYRVAAGMPRKPARGNYRVLLECGWASGLQLTPLLELPLGQGVGMVCCLPLLGKLNTEPMAGVVLGDILRYLAAYHPPTSARLAAVLPLEHQRFLVERAGVAAEDLVGTDRDLSDIEVLTIDTQAWNGDPATLVPFVERGGTLILRNLATNIPPAYAALLPTSLVVRAAAYSQTVRLGAPPLLDGISQEDLLWMWGIMRENAPMQKDAAIVTHELLGLDRAGPDWMALTRNFSNDGRCRGHDTVKGEFWSEGAALAVGHRGAGRIILDQINWDDGRSYAQEKLIRIVSTLYGALHVARGAGQQTQAYYQPLPLKPNRALGEWMGWESNNLARFPVGRIEFEGAPFVVPDQGPQVIVLRAEQLLKDEMPERIEGIPVNALADELCFLQTCAYGFDFEMNKTVVTYRLHYNDGTAADLPVRYGVHIFDWQMPGALSPETKLVWDGGTPTHEHAFVYLMRRGNPHPRKKIASLDVLSGLSRAAPALLGLTLCRKEGAAATPAARGRGGPWAMRVEATDGPAAPAGDGWAVIGPFPNLPTEADPLGSGLAEIYPPEVETDLAATYKGKSGFVRWRTLNTLSGAIDFSDQHPSENEWSVAYAFTRVYAPAAQTVIWRFGSDDGARVWFNGRKIVDVHTMRNAGFRHEESLDLRPGWNELLVKVEQSAGGWCMRYRFEPATGLVLDPHGK